MSDILVGSYADSLYNTYDATSTSSGTKLEKKLNSKDMTGATDEELMDACKEFETYFTEQMFKAMEKTAKVWQDEENSTSSKYKDFAMDTLRQEISSKSTEGRGIGIAQMIFEQMKRNYSSTKAQIEE